MYSTVVFFLSYICVLLFGIGCLRRLMLPVHSLTKLVVKAICRGGWVIRAFLVRVAKWLLLTRRIVVSKAFLKFCTEAHTSSEGLWGRRKGCGWYCLNGYFSRCSSLSQHFILSSVLFGEFVFLPSVRVCAPPAPCRSLGSCLLVFGAKRDDTARANGCTDTLAQRMMTNPFPRAWADSLWGSTVCNEY